VVSAIKALTDSILEGKKLEIKSILSGDYNTNTSIFISGVHEQATDEDLKQEFLEFGLILSSMVLFLF
jgi:RNA recognition motif-containing protein